MAGRTLTRRELSRATLARQMLLERSAAPAPQAIERLAGLQAQLPVSPYVALWSRLHGFRREDLAAPIEARTVVKATLMRATLHLVTAGDYLALRGPLQPALDRASASIARRRGDAVDLERVLGEARRFMADEPRTFAEISAFLERVVPGEEVGPIRYAVRTRIPLVQVPIARGWSYPGNPRFALADSWLGRPIPADEDLQPLVRRYLAAFGPAGPSDMQTWSGLPGLKLVFEEMRPGLLVYRDEAGHELFDLPDSPAPPGDSPAPPRFLPPFDNLLMGHSDRSRVVADEYRPRLIFPNLAVPGTFLVDGTVAGIWRIEKTKGAVTLWAEAFQPIADADRAALAAEGEALLGFVEATADTREVRFT